MKRPSNKELKQLYQKYKLNWNKYHSGPEYKGMAPVCYDEWLDNEYKNRFYAFVGFNTKQIWLHDSAFEVIIDPPIEVLNKLTDWHDGNMNYETEMDAIVSQDPDWLYDREYWYDENMEV